MTCVPYEQQPMEMGRTPESLRENIRRSRPEDEEGGKQGMRCGGMPYVACVPTCIPPPCSSIGFHDMKICGKSSSIGKRSFISSAQFCWA